jgi:hypothetical protein
MSRVAPEMSNRSLASVTFLSDAQAELFEDLRLRVERLRLPEERPPIPSAAEAGAWSKLYGIYCELKRRRNAETINSERWDTSAVQLENDWHSFLNTRIEFLEHSSRNRVNDETRAYLGLLPDDLSEPVAAGDAMRFAGVARHPDWRGRWGRISHAMEKLKSMSVQERVNIPNVMLTRRLMDAVKTLTEKVDWLDTRISAIESASISPKH